MINSLKNQGHQIYLITARSVLDIPKEQRNTKDITDITLNWLNKNNIYFNHLEMCCFNKDVFCKQNNIDVMIEDSPTNLIKVSQYIPVICMDCSYNRSIVNPQITRVYNWDQIAEIFK